MTSHVAMHDFSTLKARLKSMWMAGNYEHFSRPMEPSGARFFHDLNVPAGARLLDVACGSGEISLIAAAAGAEVTGVDIADNLVEAARKRASARGLDVRFEQGDAEQLPFEDRTFDVVISAIGAMFAPRPERVAAEMVRVCRPGGMIAMANWTKQGFVGKMFGAISQHISPPAMPSPLLWGDEETVRSRFGDTVQNLRMSRRHYIFEYPFGPADVVSFFREYYGPMWCAFEALSPSGQAELRNELETLWTQHNLGTAQSTRVEAEYLHVVAERTIEKEASQNVASGIAAVCKQLTTDEFVRWRNE